MKQKIKRVKIGDKIKVRAGSSYANSVSSESEKDIILTVIEIYPNFVVGEYKCLGNKIRQCVSYNDLIRLGIEYQEPNIEFAKGNYEIERRANARLNNSVTTKGK